MVNKAKATNSTTNASGPVTVGSDIHDTATIEGLIDPSKTATINFKLYGPNDPTCTHEALNGANGQDVTVDQGNGEYESPAFTTHLAGTYHWIAHFSGDANNEKVDSACDDENETSVVEKASPDNRHRGDRHRDRRRKHLGRRHPLGPHQPRPAPAKSASTSTRAPTALGQRP